MKLTPSPRKGAQTKGCAHKKAKPDKKMPHISYCPACKATMMTRDLKKKL